MQHDLATDPITHTGPTAPDSTERGEMTSTDAPPSHQTDEPRRGRRLRWILLGLIGAVVLFFGAIFLYAKVLNDSPDELGASDLDAALDRGAETVDSASADTGVAPADTATAETAGTDAGAATGSAGAGAAGGVWQATTDSELGYRVKEVLFGVDTEAVGRTNQITGSLTIDDAVLTDAAFEVDVASIESDDGRRDNQFRGRIMSADQFPTASFVLTQPIDLGTEPVEGATVSAEATGELTLRGATNEVTFDLDAEVRNGRIGVLGSIPVTFADYSIANPSFGGVTTEDQGLVEFVLVFEPAG